MMFFVCLSFNTAFILNGNRTPHLTRDIRGLFILWSSFILPLEQKKDQILICP